MCMNVHVQNHVHIAALQGRGTPIYAMIATGGRQASFVLLEVTCGEIVCCL